MVQVFKGHEDVVYSVAFSPDGESILTGSNGIKQPYCGTYMGIYCRFSKSLKNKLIQYPILQVA